MMENQRQPNSSGLHFYARNCEPSFTKDVSVRLRDLWRCLESKQDLLDLVNIALEGLYGDMTQTVSMKQLANMAYTGNGEHRYSSFQIPKKKKGEFRTIDAPVPLLKNIQRALNGLRNRCRIESFSSMVMMVYRPDYYKLESFEDGSVSKNLADIIVAKNSFGSTGDVRMHFYNCAGFGEVSYGEEVERNYPLMAENLGVEESELPF